MQLFVVKTLKVVPTGHLGPGTHISGHHGGHITEKSTVFPNRRNLRGVF